MWMVPAGATVCKGVSNREVIIRLNGSINVLGAPRDGDALGYPGGAPL